MAISNNPLLKNASGKIGKGLVLKQYGDKTVISKYPDMSRRKLSKAQEKTVDLFEMANAEARRVLADDTLRNEAQVRLDLPRNKLYRALIREQFALLKAEAAKEEAAA